MHNPGDLRVSNRADRGRSPEIDEDVTGRELTRAAARELTSLDERNRGWVSKHLVMAGRLIEDDPALAFDHAMAASRRGGRLACVREAVALTAYAAGEYADALREFRTYRRMTGDNLHLAAQVDSERALGRPEKALGVAREVDAATLDRQTRAELAMVVSGIHEDLGDLQGALDALQIPELDRRRGYPFSPRLFQRHADVLTALGRTKEAAAWSRQARVAEKALGLGSFADPEIVDLVGDDEQPARTPRAKDLVAPDAPSGSAPATSRGAMPAVESDSKAPVEPETDEAAESPVDPATEAPAEEATETSEEPVSEVPAQEATETPDEAVSEVPAQPQEPEEAAAFEQPSLFGDLEDTPADNATGSTSDTAAGTPDQNPEAR